MAYGYMEPVLAPLNSGPGKITLADILPLPFWVLALIGAGAIITFLIFLEKWRPWQEDLGLDYDGVPSGSSKEERLAESQSHHEHTVSS